VFLEATLYTLEPVVLEGLSALHSFIPRVVAQFALSFPALKGEACRAPMVENTLNLRAAGVHPAGHFRFGDLLCLHRLPTATKSGHWDEHLSL